MVFLVYAVIITSLSRSGTAVRQTSLLANTSLVNSVSGKNHGRGLADARLRHAVARQRCADPEILSPRQGADFDQRSATTTPSTLHSSTLYWIRCQRPQCILPRLIKNTPELIAHLL